MPARLNGEQSQGHRYPLLQVPGRSDQFSTQDQRYELTLFIRRNEFHRIRKCQIYFYNNNT
jgi:hypothetical protein